MSYLPIPPRVWSRVQNQCTFDTSTSNLVYEPLTGQFLSQEEYNKQKQIQIKGNILQYKNNSTNLTKKQKYSQIAKGKWINRTKTWATQSLTYSNPNTTSLQRVNTSTLAATANTPFVTNTYSIPPNPFNCPIYVLGGIIDGGNLVGTVTVNPCTNDIIKVTSTSNCNLSTDCDVPGPPIALCWNPRLPTYYPRQNLTNNNSTDKWPVGYKGLVSALKPLPPILSIDNIIEDTVYLSWTYSNVDCIPITSFYLYQILNGTVTLVKIIHFPLSSTEISNLESCVEYTFYLVSYSNVYAESDKSNEVSATVNVLSPPIITSITGSCTNATLTWIAPNITCINISEYYVYQDNIKIATLSPNILTYSVTGLTTCTDYFFNISYYDSISNQESYLSNTALLTEIPCPPTINSITFDYTNNSQNILFSAPVSTCTVSYYNLYQTIIPVNTYSNILAPGTYNLTAAQLQNNTTQGEHTFYMTSFSTNNNTESSSSNVFAIPPPPIISAVLTNNPGELLITWSNNTITTPGLSITTNKIYIYNVTTSVYTFITPVSSPYTFTGAIGNTYDIYVTAIGSYNSNNTESIFSNLVSIITPPIITLSNIKNINPDSYYDNVGYSYGILIFSDPNCSIDIAFNYPGYQINIITIGPGGNGGDGGLLSLANETGGGGGGGGGGGYTATTITGGNYKYNINVGTTVGANTTITYGPVPNTVQANSGSTGSSGNSVLGGSGGSGGTGGIGGMGSNGANGGRGDDYNLANGSAGGNATINTVLFNVGSGLNLRSYQIGFGGGGGGGANGVSPAPNPVPSPGPSLGYNGGATAGNYGGYNTDGYPGIFLISNLFAPNYNIQAGGGGGGGSGNYPSQVTSYKGGSGSQGIVIFYWTF